MPQTLEKAIEQEGVDFIGPDFSSNGYCNARYRVSKHSVRLVDTEVPARVEVLNTKGKWQQHPVVFIHYGDHEARKNEEGILVMFLPGGKYTSCLYKPLTGVDLYRFAKNLGITRGSMAFIHSIVKEEE